MMPESNKVLFLVTGMTPAIITETLWALACDPELDENDRWIPNQIKVLSTEHGLNQIQLRLLSSGVFEKLKQDYPQLAQLEFSAQDLYSINDAQGNALADLRTPEDNERAADTINQMIRDLASNPNNELHVSIAGGRKTMGFYAGYALSLYGRAQDRMSHVLADERYENIREFFYPTPYASFVTDRDGNVWDAQKAQVWLAEIPFVRMKDAINKNHQLKSNDSFSEVVHKIESSFNKTSLVLDLDNNIAIFNGIPVDNLPPREFAFLHWFADLKKSGQEGVLAPKAKNNDTKVPPEDASYLFEITNQFRAYYNEQKAVDELSVDKTFFNTTISRLRNALPEKLGFETAAKFQIRNKNGKKGAPFELEIPAEAIEIVSNF